MNYLCRFLYQVTANPCDINVLAEYKNDPRVVSNLIDGVNRTRDDVHMWLAPFTEAGNHFICLTFTQPTAVALMRIWVSMCSYIICCLLTVYGCLFIDYYFDLLLVPYCLLQASHHQQTEPFRNITNAMCNHFTVRCRCTASRALTLPVKPTTLPSHRFHAI